MIDFTRLRDIREDNDLSQKDMANILNIKRPAYSLWELGINVIPLKNLIDFADHFNYAIDYVLGITNDKNSQNYIKGIDLQLLGKNLKDIRLNHHLSQENLANMLGVTQACIARYEKGEIYISTSNLYKISKTFNISMNELCGKNKKNNLINNK